MRAQVSLEFVLSFLTIIVIVAAFVYVGGGISSRINDNALKVRLHMKAETAATYCNLVYLNWKNIGIEQRFDLEGVWIDDEWIMVKQGNHTVGVQCLSPEIRVSGDNMEISGVKRWF